MAPEQLEGKEADARSDIFAFGAVLYEMVTGRSAFEGKTQASLIAAILSGEPPAISSPRLPAPAALDHVIRTCLAKDPEGRWQAAGDLKRELQWAVAAGTQATVTGAARPGRRERLAWALAGFFLLGLMAALSLGLIPHWREEPARQEPARFSIYPPEKTNFAQAEATVPSAHLALSPDGRKLAFVASAVVGPSLLWVRAFDDVVSKPLPGTEGAVNPFWSPDSRGIAFFAQNKLKKIDVGGGPAQILGGASALSFGGTWSPEGIIMFSPHSSQTLYRVRADGSPMPPLPPRNLPGEEGAHRWPYYLPDGLHFLYFVRGPQPEYRGIHAGSVDGKTAKYLRRSEWGAIYAWPGYLLYLDGTTLMAQAFDADRLELKGQVFPVAPDVAGSTTGYAAASASHTGVLAYANPISLVSRLTWFDRSGKPGDSIDPPGGRRVAVARVDSKTHAPDIWLHDFSRRSASRFTFDPALDACPLWSPDGSRIAFRSNRAGPIQLYVKLTGAAGSEEVLFSEPQQRAAHGSAYPNPIPTDWSPDGRFIVYVGQSEAGREIWALPLAGERKPFLLVRSQFNLMHANLSPDGKWMAYASDESGRFEVYVQAMPGAEAKAPVEGRGKWPVSTDGGYEPRWRGDGKELYYIAADRKLMSVPVKTGSSFEAGIPHALFATRIPAMVSGFRQHYVPAADGQRFLIGTLVEEERVSPITVVLNWTAGLKQN